MVKIPFKKKSWIWTLIRIDPKMKQRLSLAERQLEWKHHQSLSVTFYVMLLRKKPKGKTKHPYCRSQITWILPVGNNSKCLRCFRVTQCGGETG